jgi:hypothetical protein
MALATLPSRLSMRQHHQKRQDALQGGDILVDTVMMPYIKVIYYNLVPRPAVLLIDERQVQVVERRETYEDLLVPYKGM